MAQLPQSCVQQHGLMMELSVTGDAADVWIVIRATTLDGIYLWARYDPGGVPCPGVVARTELLGVSPVSGEPMASEHVSGKGASHHRPTDLTAPATLPALHRNGTTEPRSTVSEASGPGAPSSPGPHPNRAGGGDNNPVHGADGHPWHVLGYEHTRPSTYQGTTVALEPLRSNKRTPRSRVDRPAGAFAPQT